MGFEELGLRGEEEVMAVVLSSSFASCSGANVYLDLNQGVLEITPKYASEAVEKKHFSCFCSVCENLVIKEYSPQKSSQGAVSVAFEEEIWASREAQGLCRACTRLPQEIGDFADEFYFKMIKSKTGRGVHRTEGEANKYTNKELMLMKKQDIGYIFQ